MQDLAFPLFSPKLLELFKVECIGPSVETGLHRVLGNLRYVRKKVKAKKNVDEATKAKRQAAIFHGNFFLLAVKSNVQETPTNSDQGWINKYLGFTNVLRLSCPDSSQKNFVSWLRQLKIQRQERENLTRLLLMGINMKAKGVWKQETVSMKCGKRTERVFSMTNGTMVCVN